MAGGWPKCNYVMAIIDTVFWWMANRCWIRTRPVLLAMNMMNKYQSLR